MNNTVQMVSMPPFAEKVIRKLRRFEECTSDSQGADIGRHWFDVLTQLGLLNRVQRSPALWEMTQQGEDLLESWSAPQSIDEPIVVEAVAMTRADDDEGLRLEWLLEGGIAALEVPGQVLLIAHGKVTDDQGRGEVYTHAPARPETGDKLLAEALLKATPSKITKCRECGGTSLTWHTQQTTRSGVVQGRLRTDEVSCVFFLGCDDCSETLALASADNIAQGLPIAAPKPEEAGS